MSNYNIDGELNNNYPEIHCCFKLITDAVGIEYPHNLLDNSLMPSEVQENVLKYKLVYLPKFVPFIFPILVELGIKEMTIGIDFRLSRKEDEIKLFYDDGKIVITMIPKQEIKFEFLT